MAATFEWVETNGSPGSKTTGRTECNFKSVDDSTTNYATSPIQAPTVGSSYSYEKWIQGHFQGSYSDISDVKFWKSGGTLDAALSINSGTADHSTGYSQPVNSKSVVAGHNEVPTDEASALALNTDGVTGDEYTDYVVLQLQVGTAAPSGDIGVQTFTMKYNES
jgi:hypothetical protein